MPMTFTVESGGNVASQVKLGRHTLRFDQPKSHGGDSSGPSPLVVFASAAGGCAHYYLAIFLKKRGIPTDDLKVDVTMAKADDSPPRLGTLDMVVHLPEGVPAKYLGALEKVVKQCPVYGTLVGTPSMGLEFNQPE